MPLQRENTPEAPESAQLSLDRGSDPRDGGPEQARHTAAHWIVLEPNAPRTRYWADVWRFRELFGILAWRDVTVRYKQTIIGVLWAVLRPFLTMVIFTVVFGRIAGLPSDGNAPYPLMVFAGLLPWTLFSTALGDSSRSLISNSNLVGKVYFPRIIIPTATVGSAVVDFCISLVLLAAMMLYFGVVPPWQALLLPAFTVAAILASLGPGLVIAALNVKYRDFNHVVPFLVQFGLYLTPVGFSSQVVPAEWRLLYSLNPMVGIVDGFRWCILGDESPVYWPGLALGLVVVAGLLVFGLSRFKKVERSFADYI